MRKKLLSGRPEMEGKDLEEFRTVLRQIDERVRRIEHDCALFALKDSIIDLLGRISQLEDERYRRQHPEV